MWWELVEEHAREKLRRLVYHGQLEITGGGWVMNDEVREGGEPRNAQCFFRMKQLLEFDIDGWEWWDHGIGTVDLGLEVPTWNHGTVLDRVHNVVHGGDLH